MLSSAEMHCAISVASAVPTTPMCSTTTNSVSSAILSTQEIVKKTSGMRPLPSERIKLAHMLYKMVTPTPPQTTAA